MIRKCWLTGLEVADQTRWSLKKRINAGELTVAEIGQMADDWPATASMQTGMDLGQTVYGVRLVRIVSGGNQPADDLETNLELLVPRRKLFESRRREKVVANSHSAHTWKRELYPEKGREERGGRTERQMANEKSKSICCQSPVFMVDKKDFKESMYSFYTFTTYYMEFT